MTIDIKIGLSKSTEFKNSIRKANGLEELDKCIVSELCIKKTWKGLYVYLGNEKDKVKFQDLFKKTIIFFYEEKCWNPEKHSAFHNLYWENCRSY